MSEFSSFYGTQVTFEFLLDWCSSHSKLKGFIAPKNPINSLKLNGENVKYFTHKSVTYRAAPSTCSLKLNKFNTVSWWTSATTTVRSEGRKVCWVGVLKLGGDSPDSCSIVNVTGHPWSKGFPIRLWSNKNQLFAVAPARKLNAFFSKGLFTWREGAPTNWATRLTELPGEG